MTTKSLHLHWQLIDPKTNKARWYAIQTSKDLFGGTVLIKRWGRIGRKGFTRIEWFDNGSVLEQEIAATIQRRILHGYQVMPNSLTYPS